MITYDVIDILKTNDEFLEASQLHLNFVKSEVFVFSEKPNAGSETVSSFQKRSIVLPLSFMFKCKEYLSYETTNNSLFSRSDNFCSLDKVVLKLSSTDSMVLIAILLRLEREFKQFQEIQPFNPQSREVQLRTQRPSFNPGLVINSIKEKFQIVHDGIQIVRTKDIILYLMLSLESH